MGDPPKIQTLRGDGEVPRTSDCFTPRTMTGNDAAFKGAEYGAWMSGPHRRGHIWFSRVIWAGTVLLLCLTGLVVYLKA